MTRKRAHVLINPPDLQGDNGEKYRMGPTEVSDHCGILSKGVHGWKVDLCVGTSAGTSAGTTAGTGTTGTKI